MAECFSIDLTNISGLAKFTEEKRIDLTLVGPELPLSLGIVDEFRQRGLAVFGPTQKGSQIEWSKAFTKKLMKDNNIPTAGFETFSDPLEAKKYIRRFGLPSAVKADGLAAGKGVLLCPQVEDALQAVDLIMGKRAFGQAGNILLLKNFYQEKRHHSLLLPMETLFYPCPQPRIINRSLMVTRAPIPGEWELILRPR